MNPRRDFILALVGAASVTRRGVAQPTRRVPKVGVLWHAGSPEEEAPYLAALLEGFKALGYVDGRTITFEHRFPNEEPAKFDHMANELAALKPDVLLAANVSAATAAKKATTTIPIVFIVVPDPVGSKLVSSLARPTSNLTGLSNFAVEVTRKRLELLKSAIPSLRRVALLINPNVVSSRRYVEESEEAAGKLGVLIQTFEARKLDDMDKAMEAMVAAGIQAVSINPEGMFFQYRNALGASLARHRLPACVFSRETMVGGALMSYGTDHRDLFRRSATFTDKLLKGAKPSDLPIELPTRIELVVNLKVAGHSQMLPRARAALPRPALLLLYALVGFAVVVSAAAGFAEIAEHLDPVGAMARADEALAASIGVHAAPATLHVFALLTHLGDPAWLTLLGAGVALWLWWRRQRALALGWVLALGGNALLNPALKRIFERIRPVHEHGLFSEMGFSFPSGHTSGATVAYGMMGYVALRTLPPAWHLPAVLGATAVAFTVGCSRVFLQVHYLSDVLAGFASGGAWLVVCVMSVEASRQWRGARTLQK